MLKVAHYMALLCTMLVIGALSGYHYAARSYELKEARLQQQINTAAAKAREKQRQAEKVWQSRLDFIQKENKQLMKEAIDYVQATDDSCIVPDDWLHLYRQANFLKE